MLHFSITMSNARNITPLTTRSIVLSLLLGSHPPVMPVAALVDFCGLFDVAPGTVRTALSRMVDRGELTTDDAGYALSGSLLTRQREQDTGRHRSSAGWDGDWFVVIVTAERRTATERRDFRARAIGSRLGELRPDIWMRPANIEIPHDLPDCLVTRGPLEGADGTATAGAAVGPRAHRRRESSPPDRPRPRRRPTRSRWTRRPGPGVRCARPRAAPPPRRAAAPLRTALPDGRRRTAGTLRRRRTALPRGTAGVLLR